MTSIAQKIAIRNAIAARSANPEAAAPARKKGFDLEAIAAGEASRSTMKRFLKSIEGIDDAALSVEQSRAAAYAEQATAPIVRDTTPFTATINFETVESKFTNDGKMTNYLVMRGCEVTTPEGETVTRTVMAFGEARDRVHDMIFASKDIEVEVYFANSVLKVVENDAPAQLAA
jgi:hypothetical protein